MLDDRDYMRPSFRSRGSFQLNWPLSYCLMASLGVAFIIQMSLPRNFPLLQYFALSVEGLKHGFVWQLLTFQFLHANIQHLAGNLLTMWFFARLVEERVGKSHFVKLYFLSGVAGGLLQSLLTLVMPSHFEDIPMVGASAGIFGLIAAFAILNPREMLLLFYVLPVRAIWLLYAETAYSVYSILFPSGNVAHSAHLGGIIFAVGYVKWGLEDSSPWAGLNLFSKKSRRERLIRSATRNPANKPRRTQMLEIGEAPPEEFISQQVDPILDKISAHGIQSLTEKEREILQAARARMAKR